jgi:competence protein ComEA
MKPFYLTLFFVFFLTTSAAAVVNINTGTLDDLTSLPGIGQVKAESIIKYRQNKGLFQKVEELKNVYGIGAKSVARLKDEITVGEASSTVVAAPAVTGVNKEKATAQKASNTPPVKK